MAVDAADWPVDLVQSRGGGGSTVDLLVVVQRGRLPDQHILGAVGSWLM